jgi:hypothetical protein
MAQRFAFRGRRPRPRASGLVMALTYAVLLEAEEIKQMKLKKAMAAKARWKKQRNAASAQR